MEQNDIKQITPVQLSEHIDSIADLDNVVDNNLNGYIRVAVVGNVDSGKSTLVGVLTKNILDDGRGSSRARVFNYEHENQTGRTSSIAQEIIGFDEEGRQVVPERFN